MALIIARTVLVILREACDTFLNFVMISNTYSEYILEHTIYIHLGVITNHTCVWRRSSTRSFASLAGSVWSRHWHLFDQTRK